MINHYFRKIENDQEVRKQLIEIRKLLKDEKEMQELEDTFEIYGQILVDLLVSDDPKIRKNAALILGDAGHQETLRPLFDAYMKETQLFVRSSYLQAIAQLDYRRILDELKKRMDELMHLEMTVETQKHLSEELAQLRDMILTLEPVKKHRFNGDRIETDCMLLASPGLERLMFEYLSPEEQKQAKVMKGYIRVRTGRVRTLLNKRISRGCLFPVSSKRIAFVNHEQMAKDILDAGVLTFLQERHEGQGPFYFRLDLKGSLGLQEKGEMIRRLASAIEKKSAYQLQNTASNYKCELRLVEAKDHLYQVFLILHTIDDCRFNYRKYAMATSMHPVRAAEIMALTKSRRVENADVLDPFCGTGTLLIERMQVGCVKNAYGVDLFGKAIIAARKNAELAGMDIHLINRDFADVSFNHPFDEVITELPAKSEKMTVDRLKSIYQIFVRRLVEWLIKDGMAFIVVTEPKWIEIFVQRIPELVIEETITLPAKNPSYLVVIRRK